MVLEMLNIIHGCAQDDLSGGYLPAKVVQIAANVAFQEFYVQIIV